MSIVPSTMVDRAADEIEIVNRFRQLVPSPSGRYENDIELNSLRPDSLRFNGRSYKAQWSADHKWNSITIAFNYTNSAFPMAL